MNINSWSIKLLIFVYLEVYFFKMVFFPLELKLYQKGVWFTLLCCFPNSQSSAWYIVGAQKILLIFESQAMVLVGRGGNHSCHGSCLWSFLVWILASSLTDAWFPCFLIDDTYPDWVQPPLSPARFPWLQIGPLWMVTIWWYVFPPGL